MGSEAPSGPRAAVPLITAAHLLVPAGCEDVVDVLLDDVRVFSLAPRRLRRGPAGFLRAPWPRALGPYLRGETTVTLRLHGTGEVLARDDVRFDAEPGRVRVVGDDDTPLVLGKWGELTRPFDANQGYKERLLADAGDLLRTLHDAVGVPAFLAYGSLLGAVREGRVIGHDNDVDLAYYSRHTHPADVLRESFTVQRRLHALGWETSRRSGGFLHVRRAAGPDAGTDDDPGHPKLDLFTAYHCEGWFAMERWVRGRLPVEAVLPLGEVSLEGRRLPAPRDAEAVLAVTYGDGWRVPDPAFAFDLPAAARARSAAWFGGPHRGAGRWRKALRARPEAVGGPSPFARRVDAAVPAGTTILDVGCGTGDDALWLARDGRRVVGLDLVEEAVAAANGRAARDAVPARFATLDLGDLRATMATAAGLALAEPGAVVYARNLLEVLHPEARRNFWLLAKTILSGGGRLFLEHYTDRDDSGAVRSLPWPLTHGLDPAQVEGEATARGGVVTERDVVSGTTGRAARLTVRFGPVRASG